MFGKKKKGGFAMELPAQAGETAAAEIEPMAPAIVEKAAPAKGKKAKGKAAQAEESIAPAAPAPAPSYTSTEEIIMAAVQAASQEAASKQAEANTGSFAVNHLVTAGNQPNRRGPGLNMAAYKSMAKNVKF